MRIMTINVWGDYYENPVELREEGIYSAITKYQPDILGLQEMTINWHDCRFFNELMPQDYTCIEIFNMNHEPIYYKTDKFDLIECGWEKLEDTPDISKHITWAVLCEIATNKKIGICNTHFWWKIGEEHDRLREKNAKQLTIRMKEIRDKYHIPIIAMGDFNCSLGSGAMNILEEHDIYSSVKLTENYATVGTIRNYPVKGADGRFHGTEVPEDAVTLDHIVTFKEDVSIYKQDVVICQDILDATDHSPVYIDIEY